jgi:large subunit ribosomal protein L18
MNKEKSKQLKFARRHGRVRMKIFGTASRPRLSVFRSIKGMYLQIIDDENSKTLASASNLEIKSKGKKTDISYEIGKLIAQKAQAKNIEEIVFDRGGYKYHGRVEAAAKGARDGGLKF